MASSDAKRLRYRHTVTPRGGYKLIRMTNRNESGYGRAIFGDCEERAMTLIVGLMGSDGWVLASDRRASQSQYVPNAGVLTPATFRNETTKIFWDPATRIAFAYAGDHRALLAGEAICARVAQSPKAPSATLLSNVGNEIFQKNTGTQVGWADAPSLLIMFAYPPVQMWSLHLKHLASEANRHDDRALIGDIHNGAKIFPLLYYSRRSIAELKLLAAHTIWTGHVCAPGAVDGLDMRIGDYHGNSQPIESAELRQLKAQSEELDIGICGLFGVDLLDVQRSR